LFVAVGACIFYCCVLRKTKGPARKPTEKEMRRTELKERSKDDQIMSLQSSIDDLKERIQAQKESMRAAGIDSYTNGTKTKDSFCGNATDKAFEKAERIANNALRVLAMDLVLKNRRLEFLQAGGIQHFSLIHA